MTTTTLVKSGTETVAHSRAVERVIAGQPTSDGAGVKLTRVLTQTLPATSAQPGNDSAWDLSAQPVPEIEFDQRITW